MLVGDVEVPERYAKELLAARAAEAIKLTPESPLDHFARGLAFIELGREQEARAEFAQSEAVGDTCRLELALLDIRQRANLKGALKVASSIAEAANSPALAGLAWQVVGLAEGKLRHTAAAVDALRRAEEFYGAAGNARGRSHLRDTLGMVEAARGRLDYAVQCYALSLVDKAFLGDRRGMAITLGNLGRMHLRAGRYADALECLRRDLEIALELDDRRGIARVHQDLGRALFASGELEPAEGEMRRSWELAEEFGFPDIAFFAQKDLALIFVARGDLAAAEEALRLARERLPTGGEPYLQLVWDAAHAELLAARDDEAATDCLEQVVKGFAESELPDYEIPARLRLAQLWAKAGYPALAESALRAALRLARSDGYTRYLAPLNEAMTRLELVEPVLRESGRKVAESAGEPAAADGAMQNYIVRQRLGNGAFGEVFRVYDPQRASDFALKRLRLAGIYDNAMRKTLLDSAYLELEAGSRVRHPGVARVWAIGTETSGDFYVVQDFIPGKSLREHLPTDSSARVQSTLQSLAQLAHALHALHEAGIVHRDLKPENVLMRSLEEPVLVDFGIAWLPSSAHCDLRLLAGTMLYMAPEQAAGKKLDARADLYALGVITYEWLAGRRPLQLDGATFAAQAEELVTRMPPPLSDFRPDAPPELVKYVQSLLAKKPRYRPASAVAVAEQFLEIAHRIY
jgi:serine/threonine-protein kinase